MKQPTYDDQTPEQPGDWRVDHEVCFKRRPVTPDEAVRARVESSWGGPVNAVPVDTAPARGRFTITVLAVIGACMGTLPWLAFR